METDCVLSEAHAKDKEATANLNVTITIKSKFISKILKKLTGTIIEQTCHIYYTL